MWTSLKTLILFSQARYMKPTQDTTSNGPMWTHQSCRPLVPSPTRGYHVQKLGREVQFLFFLNAPRKGARNPKMVISGNFTHEQSLRAWRGPFNTAFTYNTRSRHLLLKTPDLLYPNTSRLEFTSGPSSKSYLLILSRVHLEQHTQLRMNWNRQVPDMCSRPSIHNSTEFSSIPVHHVHSVLTESDVRLRRHLSTLHKSRPI